MGRQQATFNYTTMESAIANMLVQIPKELRLRILTEALEKSGGVDGKISSSSSHF